MPTNNRYISDNIAIFLAHNCQCNKHDFFVNYVCNLYLLIKTLIRSCVAGASQHNPPTHVVSVCLAGTGIRGTEILLRCRISYRWGEIFLPLDVFSYHTQIFSLKIRVIKISNCVSKIQSKVINFTLEETWSLERVTSHQFHDSHTRHSTHHNPARCDSHTQHFTDSASYVRN